MANYFSSVSWGSIASNVMPYYNSGVFQLNKYLIDVSPIDINEPGADDLTVTIGDYFIDFLGYPYIIESTSAISTGIRLNVSDLNERSISELIHYSPYPNRIGYVYRPTKDGVILSQAQLLKLDAQARDRINNIEKGVVWENRGISIDDGGNIANNITRIQLGNNLSTTGASSSDDWNGGIPFLLDVVIDGDNDCFLIKGSNSEIVNSGYTFSTDNTLSDASDSIISSSLALKTYIDNMSSGGNFLDAVIAMQVDNSLDPGASPTTGDRYILLDTGNLHANFGTITGVGDNDIVEYSGSAFVVVFDSSAASTPATVTVGIDKNSNTNHQWTYNTVDDEWVDRGAIVNHDDTGNIGIAGSGVNYGHIDTNAQTLYGLKSFNDGLGTIGTSKISFNNDAANYYFQYVDTTYGIKGNSLNGWSFYGNGNLGLNISATGKVSVNGTSGTELFTVNTSLAAQAVTHYTNSNTGVGAGNGFLVGIETAGNGIIWNRENNFIRFGTNATERMRILSTGEIGYGTATPSYFFHIKKDQNENTRLLIENTTTGSSGRVSISLLQESSYFGLNNFSSTFSSPYANIHEIYSDATNGISIYNPNNIIFRNDRTGTNVLSISGGIANFATATTGVTASLSDNSTKYATTAWVKGQGYTSGTGTVTSVAMTVPTGLSISGTPITTSGTLALNLASGYSIPTTVNQTNWNSAYSFTSGFTSNYPDLYAIEILSGTSGFLKKTAANTWSLDTNTYLTTNQTITLSGDVSGSGTTSITTTVANDSHNHTGSTISGLTNSNLSGSAGITNANLANSSITLGSTAMSLGGTYTTIAGLTSITSTSFVGNASTATILQNARTIGISGDGVGTATSFNGSASITIPFTLNTVATAGTYKSVTINAKGLVTSGSNPTTLAGYGITDAQPLDSDLTAIAALSSVGLIKRTGSGTASIITDNSSNWNTAYGWGNHAGLYVTKVAAGNGMYFSSLNGSNPSGSIVMATPDSISYTSTNSFPGTYGGHSHKFTPNAFYNLGTKSSDFNWNTDSYPNAYVQLGGNYTMTLQNVTDGESNTIRIYTGSASRTLGLTVSGFTKYIDGGASLSGSNLSLEASSYYCLTYQAIGTTIFFNMAKYNTL